jgi:hypothetical protein
MRWLQIPTVTAVPARHHNTPERTAHFMQAKTLFNMRPHASNYHLQETTLQFRNTNSNTSVPIIFTTALCTFTYFNWQRASLTDHELRTVSVLQHEIY